MDDLTRLVLFLTEEIADVRADAAVLRRMLVKPTAALGTSEKDRKAWLASPERIEEHLVQIRAEERAMMNDVEVLLDHAFSDL